MIFVRGHNLLRDANSFQKQSSRKTASFEEQNTVVPKIHRHSAHVIYRIPLNNGLFPRSAAFEISARRKFGDLILTLK